VAIYNFLSDPSSIQKFLVFCLGALAVAVGVVILFLAVSLVWTVIQSVCSSIYSAITGKTDEPEEKPEQPKPKTTTFTYWIDPDLISLCGGNEPLAMRLLLQVRDRYPSKSISWCNEKAMVDLMRDRKGAA
jgi:hypothetical protein